MPDSSSSRNSSSHDGSSSKSPESPSSGSKSSSSSPPPSDSMSKSPPPDSGGSGSSSPSPPKSPPPDDSSSKNSPSPPKSGSSSPPPSMNNDAPPPSPSAAASSSSSSSSPPPPKSGSSSPSPSSNNDAPPPSPSAASSSSSSSPPPPSSQSSSSPPPLSSSSSTSSSLSPPSSSSSSSSGHPPPPKNNKQPPSPPNLSSKDSPPSPPLNPETPSDSSMGSKQTPSTHPDNSPSSGGSRITPPSRHGESSSSTPSSSTSSSGSNHNTAGLAVSLAVAGIAVILIALIIVASRKKKRKRGDGLATYYKPPNNYSGRSDGYYYRQENPVGNASHSSSYYASQPPIPHASGIMNGGSQRGQVYHSGQMEQPVGPKSWFSYEELMELTQGFSRDNLLGEGGFGCVYKGYLPDGKPVAVKQLKVGSGQGEREFQAEVEIISRVHHRHLVSLVGYCMAEHHRLLVYEFVPNDTLEHHLHGKGVPVLDWSKRVKIAIGSARGLAYLHEDCHPKIIHRDIKSANILLDNSFEAQVADFGLAKLSNDTNTHVSTRVMGTFGYMAPEYASSGKLTDRSDVFSFGVVLLELITGRKPVDAAQPLGDESLVEWARPHLVHAMETGEYDELVDPRLEKNYTRGEMFRMVEAAAACVRHSAPKRPRMVQVVKALDFDDDDLSNGVKLGQSQVFDSGQYSADIERFRRMAFGSSQYSGEYGISGEHERRSSTVNSGEFRPKPPGQWTSNEWEPGMGSRRIEPQPPPRPPSQLRGDGESESETQALRYSRGLS